MDDEEEAIQKRKLTRQQKILEAKRAEEQLTKMLRVVLEPSAYDRISNVRHVNHELYIAAAQYVLALYKRTNQRVTEQQLLNILSAIKSEASESERQIRFERK